MVVSDPIGCYPWLVPARRRLAAYLEAGRLPQGLLISGAAGLGKGVLADDFARRLLCISPSAEGACGTCQACHLAVAGNHPDYLHIEPEEAGKRITIDPVRRLIDRLSLKPQYSASRVVVIRPAHAMNIAAANSLLKTLEEPDPHTLFLLISERPAQLPATVLSRCQRLEVRLPAREDALRWLHGQGVGEDAEALLAMAGGAPLKAAELHGGDLAQRRRRLFDDWLAVLREESDPLAVAEHWAKEDGETVLTWLHGWIADLIRIGSTEAPGALRLANADLEPGLRKAAAGLNLRTLFAHLDEVDAARRNLEGQANRQLIMEDILINWSRLGSRGARH
ncbi:DNA polymerase III subunit delta' [Methylococcus sp. BF19-07]|uniref:DNA polymerase III subunit delta' n=1 Tax=Methylococcus TaxID=413 RepID=UPI001E3DFD7C|nr:DNA polymerase III subunit delta' [Methylococcus sp. BF19-07]